MRRKREWSWENMREHREKCREYESLYTKKLSTKSPSKDLLDQLRRLEDDLDEFNIRIQRQLAENQLAKSKKEVRHINHGL